MKEHVRLAEMNELIARWREEARIARLAGDKAQAATLERCANALRFLIGGP